jgi:hypothetical protein
LGDPNLLGCISSGEALTVMETRPSATFSLILLTITNGPAPKFWHPDVLELAVEGLLFRQLHLNRIPRIPDLIPLPPEAQ